MRTFASTVTPILVTVLNRGTKRLRGNKARFASKEGLARGGGESRHVAVTAAVRSVLPSRK